LITAGNTAQVFLNHGNGSFYAAKASGVLNNGFGTVWAGAVGDFNGDGHLDFVAKDTANNRNLILLGRGDGTFSAPIVSNIPPTSNYGPMAAADLDGDGNLDLAMANVGPKIQIMLGDGRGSFRLGTSIKTKAVVIDSLIAADLGGKGKSNLVATTGVNFGNNFCVSGFGVAVLSQGSNGNWAEADYPTGTDPESVVAADMNGDGRLDLVVANAFSSSISILLNKGGSASSSFSPAIRYTPGPSFIDNVSVKDLNHDGKPDIVFRPNGALNVLLNQGDARFLSGSLVDVGLLPQALAVSDLNHDGIPDLALIGFNGCPEGAPNQFISILSENGQALATGHLNYSGDVWDIGLGDINGNGSTDAVLSGNPTSKILTSLLNKGNGTFSLASNPFTDVEDDGFAVGNYNSGGKADVATIATNSNEFQVLFGKGNGEFGSPATYHTGSNPVSIGKRDLNGDGYADLVVANSGDNTVSVFLGTAAGKFGPGKQYAAGKSPKQVAFGDFNRERQGGFGRGRRDQHFDTAR
jgi:hypothetical protein